MDQEVVRKLEKEIETAVAGVIRRLELKHQPLLPSRQTMHLMAKSAVTLYEAAVIHPFSQVVFVTPCVSGLYPAAAPSCPELSLCPPGSPIAFLS